MSIECPNPAYDKIIKSGLDKKILEKGHLISYEILLNRSIYFENCEKFFEKEKLIYLDENRKISEKSESAKRIFELENEFQKDRSYMMPEEFGELLIKYPNFLGKIVLGDEIYNYEKYGFSSQKSLEESLTSFCISEQHLLGRNWDNYIWRTKNMKNEISKNVHGDLYASQFDVSGKNRIERTLFGDIKVFDTIKEIGYEGRTGISAYQDWSQFLVSLLKYAEYLGKKEMSEIVNWRKVLEEIGGGSGTATAEAFGGTYENYQLKSLMETPVLSDKIEKIENFPLRVYSQDGSSLTYIENSKLFYLKENEKGNISLEKFSHIYKDKKFSKVLEYSEEDLIPLLSANYKYFARDRSKMTKILNYFNKEKK